MIDGRLSRRKIPVELRIEGSVERARDEFETLDCIVSNGMESYEFEGDDLIEFVRRSIYAMVDGGAQPFDGDIGGVAPDFRPTGRWGTTREA